MKKKYIDKTMIMDRRQRLREIIDEQPDITQKEALDKLRIDYPHITKGQFISDWDTISLNNRTTKPTEKFKIKIQSRQKELAILENITAELQSLLNDPVKKNSLDPDMRLKIYTQLQNLSTKKIKLIDEIEKEKELYDTVSTPKGISTSEKLQQELLRKKLEEAELKINKMSENLVAKEEIEYRWDIIEKELAALLRNYQRHFGMDHEATQLLISTMKSINTKLGS